MTRTEFISPALPSGSKAAEAGLSPIMPADVPSVAKFLNTEMNGRVAVADWIAAITLPWENDPPNHGFLLRVGERLVGVHLAFYSTRNIDGKRERFCNLGAWCVIEEYRSRGLALLRALLAQKGYHFTDFSPSGNVVSLNRHLKFASLDVTTVLVPNLFWPPWSPNVRIVSKPSEIQRTLQGDDLQIYHDHAQAGAARHVVAVTDRGTCYVIFRRDRRKRLPLFASILHVGNRELFRVVAPHVFRHLLTRHGIPFTLAELRVVGDRPKSSIALKSKRPKMYRSSSLRPDQIDYLYSELMCVPW